MQAEQGSETSPLVQGHPATKRVNKCDVESPVGIHEVEALAATEVGGPSKFIQLLSESRGLLQWFCVAKEASNQASDAFVGVSNQIPHDKELWCIRGCLSSGFRPAPPPTAGKFTNQGPWPAQQAMVTTNIATKSPDTVRLVDRKKPGYEDDPQLASVARLGMKSAFGAVHADAAETEHEAQTAEPAKLSPSKLVFSAVDPSNRKLGASAESEALSVQKGGAASPRPSPRASNSVAASARVWSKRLDAQVKLLRTQTAGFRKRAELMTGKEPELEVPVAQHGQDPESFQNSEPELEVPVAQHGQDPESFQNSDDAGSAAQIWGEKIAAQLTALRAETAGKPRIKPAILHNYSTPNIPAKKRVSFNLDLEEAVRECVPAAATGKPTNLDWYAEAALADSRSLSESAQLQSSPEPVLDDLGVQISACSHSENALETWYLDGQAYPDTRSQRTRHYRMDGLLDSQEVIEPPASVDKA